MGRTARPAGGKNHYRRPSDHRDGRDEFLQVLNQSRFMLNRGNGRGRARHEGREQTFVDVFFLNLLAKLRRDVDDVAEAGSVFDDFIGANL